MSQAPQDIPRRKFLQAAGSALLGSAVIPKEPAGLSAEPHARLPVPASQPVISIERELNSGSVSFLSWDTEGGSMARRNLLRSPLVLRFRVAGTEKLSSNVPAQKVLRGSEAEYRFAASPHAEIAWKILVSPDQLTMTISADGSAPQEIEAVEMLFPFDPGITPVTILAHAWSDDGHATLPAVLSAPDFGQLLFDDSSHPGLTARLEGSRAQHSVDLIVELPPVRVGEFCRLTFTHVILPPPDGMTDGQLWQQARRGWFNVWQSSSRWGDQNRPFSAPAGILANNVISDPVSFALPFYADQALWTPLVAPGVSVMDHVRRSIEWWLDHRTDSAGEAIGYWDYRNFLDANPGLIIASWDYVEATHDVAWLAKWIGRLELLSDFLERRDVDGDGMVEATQSGNSGTLIEPARSCCWWDALNCGYKDGYSNALIWRAWCCLAELEGMLGRSQQQAHWTMLAKRLKAVYSKTLMNPETGWLAWWKSADGELHDYATPVVNGLAIAYGLVEPAEGRTILARLNEKIRAASFTRMDLGLPCTLIPVLPGDYLQPSGMGTPHRPDGTDTFQQYMNGGISAGHTLSFIVAHYVVGQQKEGDRLLQAMLDRQDTVGFQNGVRNAAGGVDWTTWDGTPCGYEGYLADVFMFLQAVVLREPALRVRFQRPLKRVTG